MDQQKAIQFILARGDASEQARLNFILTGEMPSPTTMWQFFSEQRANGSWSPFWAPNYSGLDTTCFRLTQAEQMGIAPDEPHFQRAAFWLAQRQHEDGSWEEDEAVAESAPPWAKPGDFAARLYLTANCGFWLAVCSQTSPEASLAATYLQSHLPADGHLPTFLHTHWLAAGLFAHLKQTEPVERILAYLETHLHHLPASNLAWLITTLRLAGLPVTIPLIAQAASLLERLQQPAGNWASEDGPEQDVHATLESLRALL